MDIFAHNISTPIKETIQTNRPVIAIEDNNDNCTDFLRNIKYVLDDNVIGGLRQTLVGLPQC